MGRRGEDRGAVVLSSRSDAGEVIRQGLAPVAMRSLEQGRRPGRGSWAGWAGLVASRAGWPGGFGPFSFPAFLFYLKREIEKDYLG